MSKRFVFKKPISKVTQFNIDAACVFVYHEFYLGSSEPSAIIKDYVFPGGLEKNGEFSFSVLKFEYYLNQASEKELHGIFSSGIFRLDDFESIDAGWAGVITLMNI